MNGPLPPDNLNAIDDGPQHRRVSGVSYSFPWGLLIVAHHSSQAAVSVVSNWRSCRCCNISVTLIYEVIGRVKQKILHTSPLDPGRLSRAPPRAFILTLDSLPGSLTMERGNEAKRSSVELRSVVEKFGFLVSVSSVWRGTEWQPRNTPLRAFLNICTCRLDQKAG